MAPWGYAMLSVTGVSLISLVGVLIVPVAKARLPEVVFLLVSLAVGAMFGNVALHLLPESFAHSPSWSSAGILVGLFLMFLMEKYLWWRHQHLPDCDHHPQPFGYVNLVADGLHNLIDGFLIGASYLVSVPVGVATTIAVLLHEIPQEIGDFGILLHAGMGRAKALTLNLLSASLAIVGTVIALLVGQAVERLPDAVLPITAGSLLYVAGSDLVPELHKERRWKMSLLQGLAILAGVGLMVLVRLIH